MSAKQIYKRIDSEITGRIGITTKEANLLYDIVKDSRLHIEIGCLWGASAIFAKLAGAKRVVTIDKMRDGFWFKGDPAVKMLPTREIVENNFHNFGVEIEIVEEYSNPFPVDVYPETMLIDGGHSYFCCLADWNNAKERAEIVMFHDYDKLHAGVVRAVDEHVKKDSKWLCIGQADSLIVFQRKYYETCSSDYSKLQHARTGGCAC